MHLKKIKLAGFKSFVDPTIIPFRSFRTAVVGPNGCGKSNVIDAVRWVMGESSAKHLRGEAMSDVIFNGTTTRKPIGQAAVELFFDNTDNKLGGEYAQYNELAIRREVNRDGFSNYYLNSVRCRRKDVINVFLGTGLGPRSYSIIEQGMITQLIEAKPDDLRSHLEEAAGISKYKERRRETENRIRHTRDNLDRLNDIREELDKQLRHLKRQANAAVRYKEFKQEQRELKAQLQAILWQTVSSEVKVYEEKIQQQEIELEAKLADQSRINAEIEKSRIDHTDANDIYNEVQGRYYNLGSEIGRLEQQIQHNKERCSQLGQDLMQLNSAWDEAQSHIKNDTHKISDLNAQLTDVEPRSRETRELLEQAEIELMSAEETMQEWQIAWDSFANKAEQSARQAEVEQTRITHLEQRIENEKNSIARLEGEQGEISTENLKQEITEIEAVYAEVKNKSDELQNLLHEKQGQINRKREENKLLANELNSARHELQKLNGRYASLEALQQAALGKNDHQINAWLQDNSLVNNSRLAQGIEVAAGWEKAVETVLSSYLEAVCVENIDHIAASLGSLGQGNITLYETGAHNGGNFSTSETLAGKVTSQWELSELLAHICIADDLPQALQLRKNLQDHQSVITRDGVWLGRSWLCVNKGQDVKQGVLQRETELKELSAQINLAENLVLAKESDLQTVSNELSNLEKDNQELQGQLSRASNEYGDVYGQLSSKKTRLEHLEQRAENIAEQLHEQRQRLIAIEQQLVTVREIWRQAVESKASDDEKRAAMQEQRAQYRAQVEMARTNAQAKKERADEVKMKAEFARNQLQYLQQSLERAQQQITSLTERREKISEAIKSAESPLDDLSSELERSLTKRVDVENELISAKQKLENIEYSLQQAERNRTATQEAAQTIRDIISQTRMDWKALQVRGTTYEEQIQEGGYELEAVLQGLSEEFSIADWETQLETIGRRIDRLGPINLAAIDEYDQNMERKVYLDAQNDDLVEALTILEDAIHKIDRETKARFKETFNAVNNEFTRLFPIIFGGGKAYLELTGDDLLSTGVMIHAQPPGKKNTTIHLLSGGEKALTAIALVFAIFQLNPAPFCMLDEVDAPLDDNNVVRFINLVKEMSETVQFIFVTHNKITMEMADQLTGVTMHEPGVSRIVAVDIKEAIDLAEK
ncbi:MAG: chromosome segregation protein SMC [Gammaproteobacteria bacterium]|nr:chromosome segregation protein SMC [Gammaproteobacteria bacterium]